MSKVKFEPFQKVLVRDNENQEWRANLFSNESTHIKAYVCTGFTWKFCIPYEGNEHLLGTTDGPTPPEPEFNFGDKVEVRTEGNWKKAIFLKKDNRELYFCVVEGDITPSTWCGCRHADW